MTEARDAISAFDAALAAALVGFAWQALIGRNLYRSIIVFICLGVVLTIAWGRLGAPDLALAEAAIGAGLTSALLLRAAHRLAPADLPGQPMPGAGHPGMRAMRAAAALLLATALLLGVARAIWPLPPDAAGLEPLVRTRLTESGVSNPVTAVLLNFRAYDTLLELAVLLAAGALCLAQRSDDPIGTAPEPHLTALTHLVTPLLVLAAGYLVWIGSTVPGGAFQAGALLAGGGVLRLLAGGRLAAFRLRHLGWIGLGSFIGIGIAMVLRGRAFLEFPTAQAGALILAIEAFGAVSIGYLLVLAYQGGHGERDA